jgi:hypothetical protein
MAPSQAQNNLQPTVPIAVASGERSFSKLKIIKDYLRTTMA